MLVALGLDQHIEDLALGVNSATDNPSANRFSDRFVKMPGRMRLRAALAQRRGDHWSEVVHPAPHGLVRDRNPTLGEQILDVTKAKREPQIQLYRLMYDLRREPYMIFIMLFAIPHSKRQQAAAAVTMPLGEIRHNTVHVVVFRAEHESLPSRYRDTRGTMRGDGGKTDGQTSNANDGCT